MGEKPFGRNERLSGRAAAKKKDRQKYLPVPWLTGNKVSADTVRLVAPTTKAGGNLAVLIPTSPLTLLGMPRTWISTSGPR